MRANKVSKVAGELKAQGVAIALLALAPESIDETGPRIHAFLHSMDPIDTSAVFNEEYIQGRSAIEKLAWTATGTERPGRLTKQQCVDVLGFLQNVVPREPATWWRDPTDRPSQLMGFYLVLGALEASLRRRGA